MQTCRLRGIARHDWFYLLLIIDNFDQLWFYYFCTTCVQIRLSKMLKNISLQPNFVMTVISVTAVLFFLENAPAEIPYILITVFLWLTCIVCLCRDMSSPHQPLEMKVWCCRRLVCLRTSQTRSREEPTSSPTRERDVERPCLKVWPHLKTSQTIDSWPHIL